MAIRLAEDSNLDPAPAVMGGRTLDQLAEELPESAQAGFGTFDRLDVPASVSNDDAGVVMGDPMATPQERKQKRMKMSRKMRAAMNKLKDRLGKFPTMWFQAKAEKHPEWRLSDEETEMMSESVSFALEILDIDFLIEPVTMTLTSIWWVVAYPFATFGLLWFMKRDAVHEAHPDDFPKKEEKK